MAPSTPVSHNCETSALGQPPAAFAVRAGDSGEFARWPRLWPSPPPTSLPTSDNGRTP